VSRLLTVDIEMATPPAAAAFVNPTVQVVDPFALILVGLHVSEETRTGATKPTVVVPATPPAVAVSVAVWSLEMVVVVTVNVAVEPDTVTEAGTCKTWVELWSVITVPPGAVTVQVAEAFGPRLAGLHDNVGAPAEPARWMLAVAELLLPVPDALLVAVRVTIWLAVNPMPAAAVNVVDVAPFPMITPFGTVRFELLLLSETAVHPTDGWVSVTVQRLEPPAGTVAGVQVTDAGTFAVVRFTLNVAGLPPFRVPVIAAVPLAVNFVAVVTNVTLVEPLGTVTELGTGRLPELDARLMVAPVDPLTVTVHVLAPPGATVAGVHAILLRVTAGALMPTVPPVPVTAIPLPSAEAAIGLVSPIAAALLPESVTDTVAMTPSSIVVASIP
jgi:hypothetical protein